MYCNFPFDLNQSRRVDEWFRLRIYGVTRKRILERCNWFCLFGDLFRVVELHVTLQDGLLLIRILLALQIFLQLCVFLLVWRINDTPAAAPWSTCTEAHPDPVFVLGVLSGENHADVVQKFALSSN